MTDRTKQRTRVGWLTVGFGVAGILRLIPELISEGPSTLYFLVFVFDAGLAVLFIISGSRVLRKRPRSASSAIAYWGFLATHSAILLLALLPGWLQSVEPSSRSRVLFARFLYYALLVVASPYAAYVLRSTDESSKAAVTGWLIVGVLFGAALTGLPFLLIRH